MLTNPVVLVTRPQPAADELAQKLCKLGVQPIVFPTLVLEASDQPAPHIQSFDWAIFISVNAVKFALPSLHAIVGKLPKLAAVGPATANALKAAGFTIDAWPSTSSSSDALLAMEALQHVSNQKVLVVRGVIGRERLAECLHARGAEVTQWACYQGCLPECTDKPWRTHALDLIVITSTQGLDNLCALAGNALTHLQKIPLVTMSERISEHARALSFENIITANDSSTESLVESIKRLIK